jgi:hypothetical protein
MKCIDQIFATEGKKKKKKKDKIHPTEPLATTRNRPLRTFLTAHGSFWASAWLLLLMLRLQVWKKANAASSRIMCRRVATSSNTEGFLLFTHDTSAAVPAREAGFQINKKKRKRKDITAKQQAASLPIHSPMGAKCI